MRTRLLAIGAVLISLSLSPAARAAPAVTPDPPLADVLARAAREHKLVLLDFSAIWCGPCAYLSAKVFPDPLVQAALAGFVMQKYDAEVDEGAAAAARYRIGAYPTVLVLNLAGDAVDEIRERDPAGVARHLGEISRSATAGGLDEGSLARSAEPGKLLLAAGIAEERDDLVAAAALYRRAAAADTDDSAKVGAVADLAALRLETRVNETRAHGETLIAYIERHPGSHQANIAMDGLIALPAWGRPPAERIAAAADKVISAHSTAADVDDLRSLVYALFTLELPAQARRACEAIERFAGDDPQRLDKVAEIYYESGDHAKAAEIEGRALARDPKNKDFAARQAQFAGGEIVYGPTLWSDPLDPDRAHFGRGKSSPEHRAAVARLEHAIAARCHDLLPEASAFDTRVYVANGVVKRAVMQDPEQPGKRRLCVESTLRGVTVGEGIADADVVTLKTAVH